MRELIRRCEITTENAEVLELRYYLLSRESESLFSCEASEGMLYGVSISMTGKNGDYTEESVAGFSYLKSEAVDFINEIADAYVTPESFLHIVDEYIGEG